MSISILLLAALAVVVFGISAIRTTSTPIGTVCQAFAHGVGIFVLFFSMWLAVPRFTKDFVEFEIDLLVSTELLISIGNRIEPRAYEVLAILVLVFVTDVLVYFLLHRSSQSRSLARKLSATVTVLLAITLAILIVSLLVPCLELWTSPEFDFWSL